MELGLVDFPGLFLEKILIYTEMTCKDATSEAMKYVVFPMEFWTVR